MSPQTRRSVARHVPSAARRVMLEVVAGTADRIGLDPGDRFDPERRPA
jgi:uncharacterized membrane protein (UPF0127 family)